MQRKKVNKNRIHTFIQLFVITSLLVSSIFVFPLGFNTYTVRADPITTYIYAGGEDTKKVYQYWTTNLTKKAESADYGGDIRTITQDDTYVYAGGGTTKRVRQYWKTNMTYKAQSAAATWDINIFTEDTTYIYASISALTNKVYQYWKSNLTKKAETLSYGGGIFGLTDDDTYIYAGGGSTQKVYQYWKSNLTKKAESADYGDSINTLTNDDTYVYAAGDVTEKVYQYWKSNMTKKAETADYGGSIFDLTDDDTYIYAGGDTTQKVYQYWKSNLTKKAETADYGGGIYGLTDDDTYIYAGGDTTQKVYQYWKSNLTKKAESADYGGAIKSLSLLSPSTTSAPTVTTNTATGVEETDATLRGNLTDDGGENCAVRFQYGTTTGYGTTTANQTKTTGQTFSEGDKPYVYVVGDTTRRVYQYWKSNMTKKVQSVSYGGDILAIGEDDDFVYIGGVTTRKVYQFWKSNLTKKAESLSYGADIFTIVSDGTYVYTGGEVIQKVYQYWVSNMTKKEETLTYGGHIGAIADDNTYIYYGGYTTKKVYQAWKSNLTKKAETASYGGNIWCVLDDDTYIYVAGDTTHKIYQYWKSNLTKKAESSSYGNTILDMYQDSTHLYVGGETTNKVYQYLKTTLVKTGEITYGDRIRAIAGDDTYIYFGGSANNIFQAWKSNLTKKTETASYGGTVYGIAEDTMLSLSPGTLYHYRAVANNTNGTSYGSDKTFLTKPNEPTGLIITNTGSGNQTLTWTHGTGYNHSVVRGTIGSYPASPTTGTAIYNNTGNTVIRTGLTGGDNWYYRAWEYANESGLYQFSDTYTQGNLLAATTPVVTTQNATGVEETYATLHGTLVDICAGNVSGIIEYYNKEYTSGLTIYGSNQRLQTFKIGTVGTNTTHIVTAVKLLLYKVNSPGILTIKIKEANTTGYPTGPVLSSGTTNANTLPSSHPYEWRQINITPYTLTPGTKYAIILNISAIAPNAVSWRYNATGDGYANGGRGFSTDDGSTWTLSTTDCMFEVYSNTSNACYVGFEYGLTTSYGTKTNKKAENNVTTFSDIIRNIAPGSLYHFISFANNSIGGSTGSDKTFLTKPNEPTGLIITNTGSGNQTLTWTHGTGYNHSVVRGTIGSYPASPTTGTAIYNNTSNSVVRTGLTSGNTWYYRVWEYANESGLYQFSDTYTQGYLKVQNISTVTTNITTGVEETNATLHGFLMNNGSATTTCGFLYDTNSGIPYANNHTNGITANHTAFTYNPLTLTPGMLYYARAWSSNAFGFSYGTETTFLTKPYGPLTNPSITRNSSGFTLTWTKSSTANNTVIRGKIGSYPSSPTGDVAVYNGTGQVVNHFGLTGGDTWYYRAWSYKGWSGLSQYSDNYTQNNKFVMVNPTVTTNASTGVEETNATLRGTLTQDGGGECAVGFEYGLTTGYGNTVSGVSDDYIYAGGHTELIYKYWKSNFTVQNTVSYGDVIEALIQDSTYIYAGGLNINKVYQYWKSNMTKKAETASYGGTVYALADDATYVYAGGMSGTNKVYQYWKSNMTKKAETISYGGTIITLAQDNNYIYAGGVTTKKVRQYWKSNMTQRLETLSYGATIRSIISNGTYIFVGASNNIYQLWVSNLTEKSSVSYGGTVYTLADDATYVYAGGKTVHEIRQYYKSNLTMKTGSSPGWTFGGTIYSLISDGYYIYAGGSFDYHVNKYWKNNLTRKQQSSSQGEDIYAISSSYDYTAIFSFSYDASGLTPGTLYHYRAFANNTNGTGYGADKTFLTKPQAPTGLTATDINTNHTQHLTWTHGTGYNRTIIRVSTTGYPASPTSGTQAYNNTGNSYYYATPVPGQAYFYRAWEYANESGLHQYSDTYTEATCLTKPNAPRNFILEWIFDPLVPIGMSSDQINIIWTKGTGANRTIIIRKTNSYPTSITDGTIIYNGTATNKLDTNLSVYTRYYYRSWSYTTWSGLNTYSNTAVNLTLAETSNITDSITTATTARLYGYLITQPSKHQYRFSYGQGSYTTNTTTLYMNTTGIIQRNITGLTPGKLYQYRAYANDSNSNKTYGNKKYFLTRPLAPTNTNYTVYNSSAVNLTWTKGTGSNRTVIVMNHLHNPTSLTDGTIVYNGTASYHHLSITPGTPYYCRAYGLATWTYNPTVWMYSGNGTNMTWTYLGANCYNESKPTQALTFNIQFKDEYGLHTFTALGVTNTYLLNISQIPTGTDILIKVWATGYKERLMTIAVSPSTYYNLTFYLPPTSTTTNDTGGGTTVDCITRTATNSITIGNPAIDATITFSHPLNEMIQVERYNSSVDRTLRSYTDSKTITSKTLDVWIPLNHTKESIISVQVWNTTLYGTYGGWFPVPADKYSYITGNNTIRINKTILNPNVLTITQGKVDYYYWGGGTYGAWQFVSETKYSTNTTTLIVNKTALDSFTTMLRVSYYWKDCPGQTITTPLYYCRVVETIRTEFSEFDRPVENAYVWFQTYINTTGKYVNVSILQTDGNGYVTIYLLPSSLYQVIIRKTGYDNYRSDYIPAPANQYGQTTEKLFRIERSGSTIPTMNYTYLMQNITWSLLPATLKRQGAITFTFTITSADNKLEWYNMTIMFYNKTQRRWIQLSTQNASNAGGGTLSYTTPNVTGDYEVELWFKKTGYPAYQLFQTGSLRYTIYYLQAWIRGIPDYVWFLVIIVISIIIMGFCFTVLGTGLITGYIGLGVQAFGYLMKPDIMINGFSCWVIWTIGFLMYTMGIFIWSRI